MADEEQALPTATEQRSAESSLLDHVVRIAHNRTSVLAVYVHMSRLRSHHRRPYHLRVAERSFDALINAVEAQIYNLSSGDMVVMCKDAPIDDVDHALHKLKSLFPTDPAIASSGQEEEEDFDTWFDMEINYDEFRDLVTAIAKKAESLAPKAEDASAGRGVLGDLGGQSLDPFSLAKVNDSLERSNVGRLIRQQPSVEIGADGTERILFQEHFVSITELQRRLAPGFNLLSNAWLFQHLTQTIDKRILAAIGRENLAARQEHISINLNISTIRSREFERFDAAVGDHSSKLIIELQQIDVFSDLPDYAEVRDWLSGRRYRVLLDGLNPLSLRFFNPGQLKADYVKVGWGEEFSDEVFQTDDAELAQLIKEVGPQKFILARTDSERAVRWALMLGIRRFQGRFIDLLVEKQTERDGRIPAGG